MNLELFASAETMKEHSCALCQGFLQGLADQTDLRQILVPPQPPDLHEGLVHALSKHGSEELDDSGDDVVSPPVSPAKAGDRPPVSPNSVGSDRRSVESSAVSSVSSLKILSKMSLKSAASQVVNER